MANLPVATWTLELSPSEKKTYELHHATDLKITNAALAHELADANARSTVVLHINNDPLSSDSEDSDEEDKSESDYSPAPPQKLVLTSLTPGKIESSIHDTIITRPAKVTFEVLGKNTVHLSGYLYVPPNEQFSDSEDDDEGYGYGGYDEDEEISDPEVDLRDVSSDVEVAVQDLEMMSDETQDDSHRFEEIHDDHAGLGTKRPRESDDEEAEDLPIPATNGNQKLSKKEKKKLKKLAQASEEPPAKKVKGSDGQAVPVTHTEKKAESKKGEKKEHKDKEGTKPQEAKEVKQPNGLVIKDSKVGNGAVAKKGSTVEVRFIGKLTNGTVFDSNTSGSPFRFKIGTGTVIKGMDEGLLGMKERGERILTIPPQLGYGKKATSGIPKNATLIFELKLLKVS